MGARLARHKSLDLDAVKPDRIFRGTFLPDLGLEPDLTFKYRVYVFLCQADFNYPYNYYVGIVPQYELVKRVGDHRHKRGADFTAANPSLSLLFLFPAASPAVEAYVYSAVMTQLPEHAIANGRLGGWTQTCPRSRFFEEAKKQSAREWRMVNNCCLTCGQDDHKVRNCPRQAKPTIPSSTFASLQAISSPTLPVEKASRAERSTPHSKESTRTASQIAQPRRTDCQLFQQWFSGHNCIGRNLSDVEDGNGWLPMTVVLPALGESKNNAKRYLDRDSDTIRNRKLWVLGPHKRDPVRDQDWKQLHTGKGGGYQKQGAYHCKKSFLKKIVLVRYSHKLPK